MKKLIINIRIYFLKAEIRSIHSKWVNLFGHWGTDFASVAAFQMAENKEISKIENKINKLKLSL